MKLFPLLLSLAGVLCLTGCFELNSLVTVNKDGSGTIEETVLLSAQLKAMMGAFPQGGDAAVAGGNPAAALGDLIPDKAKAEEQAKTYGEGVTVKSMEEVTLPDGRGGSKVVYAFTDVTKLTYQPGKAKAEAAGARQEPVTFALSGNELTLQVPQGNQGSPDGPKPSAEDLKKVEELDPAQMAMMKPMFAGMRFAFAVKAAGGIASTDATHVDGDTVTLVEMQMDKLLENAEALKKFARMMNEQGEPDPQKLAEEFKGIEGLKVESKEKVTIKLK